MVDKSRYIYILPLTIVLATELWLIPPSFSMMTQGETLLANDNENLPNKDKWNVYEPPDNGTPGRLEGGGTRGTCLVDPSDKLTALMPPTSVARTVSKHPTFFVYVPSNYTNKQATFTLYKYVNTDIGDPIYQADFQTPSSPGIISISLPKDAKDLEKDQDQDKDYYYYWTFALHCDPQRIDQDRIVNGWLQLVEDTQVNTKLPYERVIAYNKESIWQDTLSILADLRQANPNNVEFNNEWKSLLQSVGLKDIAEKPVVKYYSLEETGK